LIANEIKQRLIAGPVPIQAHSFYNDKLLEPPEAQLAMTKLQLPIGRLMLQIGRNSWHVIDVVLLPSARGRGIGTDLIGAVARAAQHQGARELNLTVLSGNAAARRLYARLGFIETASGAHIAMSKPLGD